MESLLALPTESSGFPPDPLVGEPDPSPGGGVLEGGRLSLYISNIRR